MRYAACRRFVTHEERISFGSNLADLVARRSSRDRIRVMRCTGGNQQQGKNEDGVKSDVLHPFRLDKKKGKGKMERASKTLTIRGTCQGFFYRKKYLSNFLCFLYLIIEKFAILCQIKTLR